MATSLPPGVKEHPTRPASTNLLVAGGGMTLFGAVSALMGYETIGPILLVIGPLVLLLGRYMRSTGRAAQIVNKALDRAQSGRLSEAEALLDQAERGFDHGYVRRSIDLQRALIAMRRGELGQALARADAASTRPYRLFTRDFERVQIAMAQAIRAMIRASTGDVDGARADIAAVRASASADPATLARAELAEAIALERSGDRSALRGHLARERRLLREYTQPRERAIVRGYLRMLDAPPTSVYRKGAPREAPESNGEPALADWVAKIAPAAAPFVRSSPRGDRGPAPAAEDAAREEPDLAALNAARLRIKPGASGAARRIFALWALLIVMFIAIWQLLSPAPTRHQAYRPPPVEEPASVLSSIALAAALLAVFAAVFGAQLAGIQRRSRRLCAALAKLARGDDAAALTTLRELGAQPPAAVAGRARLELANIAERQGELNGAIAHCDAGITRCAGNAFADFLRPGLLAKRAFLLTALDRSAEASAELALIEQTSPSYPFLPLGRYCVSLLAAIRRGDVEGAARLAEESGDLSLGPREELLGDMARAVASPDDASAAEVEHLRKELRGDAESRRWLGAVAPTLLSAFERAKPEAGERRVDPRVAEEAAALDEAAAEEAEAAIPRPSRAR
jgi:tetratricopeptide (TPR) repeat protein